VSIGFLPEYCDGLEGANDPAIFSLIIAPDSPFPDISLEEKSLSYSKISFSKVVSLTSVRFSKI